MSLNIEPKIPYLKNLRCAYTDAPAGVRMVAHKTASALYFCAAAFDPAFAFCKTTAELVGRLRQRRGIENAVTAEEALICPYTGAVMSLKLKPGFGYVAVGGYSPSTPVADPVALARDMLRRGGVVPESAPAPGTAAPRISAAVIEPKETAEPGAVDFDTAAAAAEDILAKGYKAKPGIVVPANKVKRRK